MTIHRVILGTFGPKQAQRRAKVNPGHIYVDLPTGCIARYNSSIYISTHAWGRRRLLLLLLIKIYAPFDMIYDSIWGDDEDGGSCFIRNIVALHKLRLNICLKQIKLRIISRWGQGLELVEL